MDHVASCPDCRDALRGAEALFELQDRDTGATPAGLFSKIMGGVTNAPAGRETSPWSRFGMQRMIRAMMYSRTIAIRFSSV